MDLTEEEHVCSAASKRGRHRQEVKVGPQATRSVPFVIIPMREGQYRVEVKAAVKDTSLSDGIVKMLRVVVRTPESVFSCMKAISLCTLIVSSHLKITGQILYVDNSAANYRSAQSTQNCQCLPFFEIMCK